MSIKMKLRIAKVIIESVKKLNVVIDGLIDEHGEKITLDSYIPRQKNYNEHSIEGHGNEKVVGGNPDGLINTTKPALTWEEPLWKRMMANTWFESEADVSKEAEAYNALSEAQKRMYDLTLGGLIANDSFQTRNLAVNMSAYISDPNLLALLVRQTFEEALHSRSYGVLATDVFRGRDPQKVFNLHRVDPELAKRNKWLRDLYAPLDMLDGTRVTFRMYIHAVFANLILEGLMFQGGFICMWSLGATMTGSTKFISFINRDEKTHLAIFAGIFNSLMRQFPELNNKETKAMFRKLIMDAVEVEISWLQYTTGKKVFVFSEDNISSYIKGKANSISKSIGQGLLYPEEDSVLMKIEEKYSKLNETKTNFFEGDPASYSKGTINFNDL